ncbi:MAG: c-type cytochrome domain-containing protein, partial [Planctomycetota bacterium]
MPTVPRIGRPVLAALAVLAGLASSTSAQIAQTSVDGVDLYETEVRPLLEAHCLKCHGANPERLRGGLSLTSRRGVLAGGDHGPALDAAEPARSLLLRAVGYE